MVQFTNRAKHLADIIEDAVALPPNIDVDADGLEDGDEEEGSEGEDGGEGPQDGGNQGNQEDKKDQ